MRALLVTRGLAVIAVVWSHALFFVYVGQSWWLARFGTTTAAAFADQSGSFTFSVFYALWQLCWWAMAAFLFASGFFASYAARTSRGISWSMVRKWIGTFLWPFTIWVILLAVNGWLPLALFGYNEPPTFVDAIKAAVSYAYFVPLVCQFYLLAPLIAELARTRAKWLLLGAGLLQLSTLALWYMQQLGIELGALGELGESAFFFGRWAFYFPLGMVCGFHFKELRIWLKKHVGALVGVTIFMGAISVAEIFIFSSSSNRIAQRPLTISTAGYALAMMLVLLAVIQRGVPFQARIADIGTKSLGVYLSHTIVLVTVARAVYHLYPALMFQPVLFLFVLFIPSLVLPVLFGTILSTYAKHTLYRYFFG